jgi:hypothetical protein
VSYYNAHLNIFQSRSSSSASSSNVPQDHRQVHVIANLGAFGFPWVSAPSYNDPRTMLPFPFHQLYQPQQYRLQPNSSPSFLPSRELTPWGTPGIHSENHMNYSDPITNEVHATLAAQDVAPETTEQFFPPPTCPYDGYAATPPAGPVRGPTRIQRPTCAEKCVYCPYFFFPFSYISVSLV